jgi:hypothetical protein
VKILSPFRNGARVKRRISYSDFATLSRQKSAQYTVAGAAVILIDRDTDTWQAVKIDDTAPSRIPLVSDETPTVKETVS